MGQGEEKKTKSEEVIEIQERGEIFFFERNKVDREEAHGLEDVQRLYLVLHPESGEKHMQEKQTGKKEEEEEDPEVKLINFEKQQLWRLLVIGRKSLPHPSQKSRPSWGFVEMVSANIEDIKEALTGGEYETASRGLRRNPDSRPVGEGIYRILRHYRGKTMHTHLIYKLEYPTEKDESEPQEALNIAREASFLVQIKNPVQKAGFGGLQAKKKASFPAQLQGLFGHLGYHPADPPDFLNYEGCEFLLISASDNIEEELGIELKTEQNEAPLECSDVIKTFGESTFTCSSLKGRWV